MPMPRNRTARRVLLTLCFLMCAILIRYGYLWCRDILLVSHNYRVLEWQGLRIEAPPHLTLVPSMIHGSISFAPDSTLPDSSRLPTMGFQDTLVDRGSFFSRLSTKCRSSNRCALTVDSSAVPLITCLVHTTSERVVAACRADGSHLEWYFLGSEADRRRYTPVFVRAQRARHN
jgi:hypothetical protein